MTNIRDLRIEIKRLANPHEAERSQRYFKTGKGEYGEGDKFLGIRVPVIRSLATEYHDLKLSEMKLLLKSKFHEERLLGLIILTNKFHKVTEQKQKDSLYKIYTSHFKYINNWDLVDVSAHKVVGAHLENKSRKVLYKWAKSKHLWTRRIAIIATFWFIRNGDLDESFCLAEILIEDQHDLMHKAVGWVLRECGKQDKPRLERFLTKNYRRIPRTMLRYAIEKFPEKQRKQFLNGTVIP